LIGKRYKIDEHEGIAVHSLVGLVYRYKGKYIDYRVTINEIKNEFSQKLQKTSVDQNVPLNNNPYRFGTYPHDQKNTLQSDSRVAQSPKGVKENADENFRGPIEMFVEDGESGVIRSHVNGNLNQQGIRYAKIADTIFTEEVNYSDEEVKDAPQNVKLIQDNEEMEKNRII
ncbi:hypothetical protein HMI55_004088, partial [Coelomomyces lativittatus]